MMARKFGLGRGLDALLDNNDEYDIKFAPVAPENSETDDASPATSSAAAQPPSSQPPSASSASSTTTAATGTVELPISQLVPNQGQPRKKFDEAELNELAASIKTYGIIQPVIAANAGDGTYIIIAGERRTRAAKLAGLETVPAIIRDYTDQKKLEISLIENIQRTDLNPIEEAAAYKNLMDFSNLSQDDLAARLGKNRSTVANALRLLKLPIEIQKSIEEGKVSSGHARALLSVTDAKARDKLYMELLAGEISVRETEKKAAALNSETTKGEKPEKKGKERPPEVDAMEEKFIEKLGTKVVIDGDHKKGRILIDYYSMEDLERLHDLLGG